MVIRGNSFRQFALFRAALALALLALTAPAAHAATSVGPRQSSYVALTADNNRLVNVNPDVDSISVFDVSSDTPALLKTIPVRESVAAEFRVDAFNVFNHINPVNPGNTCINCTGLGGQNAGVITGMALGTAPRQLEFAITVKF